MDSNLSFPIIDLSSLKPSSENYEIFRSGVTNDIISDINYALSNFGFLYIKGHGISEELISQSFKASKTFFSDSQAVQTVQEKYRRKQGVLLGYVDGSNEKDFADRPEDLKQAYDFVLKSKEFKAIPEDPRKTLEELYNSFDKLSKFLLRLLSLCLGKDISYLSRGHGHVGNIAKNSSTMRILHYPAINTKPEPNQSRISEHTDFGTFTMLLQDNCGGLQVLNKKGTYVEAVPIQGTIVLNIGDLLQTWSNSELKSTLHRVTADNMFQKKCTRQSIAFFTNPDNSYEIEHHANGIPHKKSVRDHIEERNNSTIFNEKTNSSVIKPY